MFSKTTFLCADFFLNKQREKAKKEAEMKLTCTMTQNVPVGESRTTTALTTMLGQYSISPMEFHKRFDAATTSWKKGVIIPVKVVKKLRAAEFDLTVKTISFPFLVDTTRFHGTPTASAFVLYDAIRFKALELKKPNKYIARLVFSTLFSYKIRRILWKEHASMSGELEDNDLEDQQEN